MYVAVPSASSLQSIGHHNKDKSRSVEDALVTKFYFKRSIFLKESIDDVNEVWREKNEHSEIKGRGDHESVQFILFFPDIYMYISPINSVHRTINFEKNFFPTDIYFSFQIPSNLIQHLNFKGEKIRKKTVWL